MKKTLIYPDNFAAPRGAYSPGLLVDDGTTKTLFLTGQLAVDLDGKVVAPYDAVAQTEYVFQLIGQVLKAGGMEFSDVVKVQTFLTHMPDFEKYSPVRNRYFADSKPVSTLLEVKGLAREGCCVEIEVVAMR
jgi:enamine deaminase RidA (YjgF/YER057c/UK114 family)